MLQIIGKKPKACCLRRWPFGLFFSFVVHWFGNSLNSGSFPGGYFMAGMGSQIAFVVLIFWFVTKQGQIDDEHGVSE